MKKTIKKAFDEQLAHDQKAVLEKILTTPVEKIDDLDMIFNEHKSRSNKHRLRFVSSIMVTACVILMVSLNYLGVFNNDSTSIVSLDVNPGFEFIVDRSNKVEKLIALNDEAKVLLEDRNYSNWGLDEVVESLIISLCKNDYITLEKNSVLVVTEDDDDQRSTDLNSLVNDAIEKVLKQFEINGNIVLKTTKSDDTLTKMAEKYNVSVGKMQLINEIVEKKQYQTEELINLSISELLAILNDNEPIDEIIPPASVDQPSITPVPSSGDDDNDDDDKIDNDVDDDDDNDDDDNDNDDDNDDIDDQDDD